MADNRMGVDDVVGVHRVRLEVEVETPNGPRLLGVTALAPAWGSPATNTTIVEKLLNDITRAMSKAVSDTLNPPTEENQNEQN